MRRLFNDDWYFAKLSSGSTVRDLDQAEWKRVDLPHDWLIWQSDDLYETADAWYRRKLDYQEDGLRHRLRFDGVYMDCDILLNGQVIASHAYGYTAFDVDLTGKLTEGLNELLVHIRHQSPNSRWYSGSGIYRDVQLISEPYCRFMPDGICTSTMPARDGWLLTVSAKVECGDGQAATARLMAEAGSTCLISAETTVMNGIATWELHLQDVQPWTLQHPVCYQLLLKVGEHETSVTIGFRTVQAVPDRGFLLNGESVKLKGVCLHHDLGALGTAFNEQAALRQLKLMKDMGANAIRTAHNPPAERFLDLCDHLGMLVVEEAFDMWERSKTPFDYARFFPEHEAQDVASWICRDRNHPSVVMWSIGNEIYDMHADERGQELTRLLMAQVAQHDPLKHAIITFGSNYMPWQNAQRCADIVKIPGYNYAERFYAAHHAQHPDWCIYGSETASILSSRDIYHFPASLPILSDEDLQCSDLGNSAASWGASDMRKCIVDDLNTPYSMGQFLWAGIDYIGEPTPYHTRCCYFGQADTACFPKESYCLIKSLWNPQPMIHIGVYWDHNPGQLIDVRVMTNAASAQLFLNGRSLGRQDVIASDPMKCCPAWVVPYEAGELRAVGYNKEGHAVLEDIRRTPGDPVKLCLTADKDTLRPDNEDIAFITVTAEDENGHPVDNAVNRVHVSVTGPCVILGMDNGDSTDPDPYKTTSRRLFSGKLLIMVGALEAPGLITVHVASEGMQSAELQLNVSSGTSVQGISRCQHVPEAGNVHDLPVRKLEISPLQSCVMTPKQPDLYFRFKTLPADADPQEINWQITTRAGIPAPNATLTIDGDLVHVHGLGDGEMFLRGLCRNGSPHPRIISSIELKAEGMGQACLDPYTEISAGLYAFSEGDIGAGNEKGIAFSRLGRSMVGFTNLDFGPVGTDRITLPLFALESNEYAIQMYLGDPREGAERFTTFTYQKPCRWNEYQPQAYTLPRRLTGVQTVAFEMTRKAHLRGIVFEKQSRAFLPLRALDADEIYGDSFARTSTAVAGIGNNVTLIFRYMDFGTNEKARLTIRGCTLLTENAITLHFRNTEGQELTGLVSFRKGCATQEFTLPVTPGETQVSFIFLPGSSFDFESFQFEPVQAKN